jgi:uncharacterized protein (DUF952 family)
MRWLFHVVRAEDLSASIRSDGRYHAPSLEREGFIHASYRDAVVESARLYFPAGADLRVLVIDPRQLDVPIDVADTPRGPMPHVHGAIPVAAFRVVMFEEVGALPDEVG